MLADSSGAPFLFLGSGFSRRYIGLEQWDELLAKFTEGLKEFRYYSTTANGNLPDAAELIAKDFHELWWSDERYAEAREVDGPTLTDQTSALKLEISKYLRETVLDPESQSTLSDEIELLTQLNVDGIITTNWDLLIEELFPDYRTFVGQEELIFSNPQSIAEIYKIHGCCSKPETLVLTATDYDRFSEKYPYLVAKLITIFIEHPVVFIGYSLADENVQAMLSSISSCLNSEQLERFSRNIFFVQRAKDGDPSSISPSVIQVGESRISISLIRVFDFSEVYAAIETVKRKVPARVLRFCKEQMYELVKSSKPEEKLAVIDFDAIESHEDIEFIVGVGVAKEQEAEGLAKDGYKGVGLDDLFVDVVLNDRGYDPEAILSEVFPNFRRTNNKYYPGYKYLSEVGIKSISELLKSKHSKILPYFNKYKRKDFRVAAFRTQFEKDGAGKSTLEIIESVVPDKAALMIPFQADSDIDLRVLQSFLAAHIRKFSDPKDSYATYFRKLAVLYDKLSNGF
ncbi:SIR2 family protein [Gymnodinialimonas ulvae]|uniref:SIR2 family protein n=1 Tax=Gymnodinialimonas ulvae TaxID=3126504 RepID=UPI0030EB90C4